MLSESKVYDRTFNEVEDAFQVNVVGYSTLGKYASFLIITLYNCELYQTTIW
jgi:hypothetical protein